MAEIVSLPDTIEKPVGLNRLSPQIVFVLVAGFFGIAMAFITPPIQVPDEPHHWYRVYQLTQGKLIADRYGGDIPVSLTDISTAYEPMAFNAAVKASPESIRKTLEIPLEPRLTRFHAFPNTALYTIFPYAPQTLTMFIARKLHWTALALLYVGRVGTVLGYLLIGWGAIRITPILKWPACMILCSPMALFLAASVSADPITTAMVFFATAVALRCILSPVPLSMGMIWSLGLAMVAATLCKSAYFPVSLLVLAIPRARWGGGHRRWIFSAVIILLTVGAFAGWSWLAKAGQVKERGDYPGLQLHWILQHPQEYWEVIRRTLINYSGFIVNSSVSDLGWLDTPLNQSVIDFLFIALVWIALAYDEPLSLRFWPRVVCGIGIFVMIGFIFTANYMVWNPVGFYVVEGMQGRYFLPIAMMMCMLFRRRGRYPAQPKWMLAMLSCIALYTTWVLIERYYLPVGIISKALAGTHA